MTWNTIHKIASLKNNFWISKKKKIIMAFGEKKIVFLPNPFFPIESWGVQHCFIKRALASENG